MANGPSRLAGQDFQVCTVSVGSWRIRVASQQLYGVGGYVGEAVASRSAQSVGVGMKADECPDPAAGGSAD